MSRGRKSRTNFRTNNRVLVWDIRFLSELTL